MQGSHWAGKSRGIGESRVILLVVSESWLVLLDCATFAVILFHVRSVTSYFGLFGLDFYYLFIFFLIESVYTCVYKHYNGDGAD